MDRRQFDALTKTIGAITRRRALGRGLGVVVVAPLLSLLATTLDDRVAAAGELPLKPKPPTWKRRRAKKQLRYSKPHTLCLNGKTVQSRVKRQVRRWQRKGATSGKCTAVRCNVTCPDGDPVACGAALNLAIANGGRVRVCPGEYQGPFPLPKDVEIIGAGSGSDPRKDTILRGGGSIAVVSIPTAVTAQLTALRITGGSGGTPNSGGVYVNNGGAVVTIDQCAVVENQGSYGGGISLYGGRLTITRSEISDNEAFGNGGGISNGDGVSTKPTLTIDSTLITRNTAANAGGIFVAGGTTTLGPDVLITRNEAEVGTGGGIYKFTASSTITNHATVTSNTPDNCTGNGFTCA